MPWDNPFAKYWAQLAAIPKMHREKRSHVAFSEAARDRCGCCPRCHEFVVLEQSTPAIAVPCPRCGGAIRELDPPGIVESD